MSDQDTLAETPDVTTNDTPVTPVNDGIIDLDAPEEVKEGDEPTDPAKPDGKAAEETAAETERKKLSGAQRAKLREQRLLNENAELQRKLEAATKAPAAKTAGDEEKAPREEDFNGDYFAFQTAKTAYEAGKAIREEIRKDREARESSEREMKQAEAATARREAHLERVEDVRETIPDFDKAMEAMKGVQVRDELIEEIMSSEKSAVLTYYLAKNTDKLEALNRLSGRELAREMGRLEATVKLPEAKKQTSAPAPLSRPSGGASPSSQEADLQAWLAKKYGTK